MARSRTQRHCRTIEFKSGILAVGLLRSACEDQENASGPESPTARSAVDARSQDILDSRIKPDQPG